MDQTVAIDVVDRALRRNHCVTGDKAHIIVTVTPRAAAKTAVEALIEAGWLEGNS